MTTIHLSGAAIVHEDEGPFEFREGDHSLILRIDPSWPPNKVASGGKDIALQGELILNPADVTGDLKVHYWGCQNGVDEPMRYYRVALQRVGSDHVTVIYTVTTNKIVI